MDKIIDELIQNYNLSDYEALAITGVIGMVATKIGRASCRERV